MGVFIPFRVLAVIHGVIYIYIWLYRVLGVDAVKGPCAVSIFSILCVLLVIVIVNRVVGVGGMLTQSLRLQGSLAHSHIRHATLLLVSLAHSHIRRATLLLVSLALPHIRHATLLLGFSYVKIHVTQSFGNKGCH